MKRVSLNTKPEWDILFPLLIERRRTLTKLPKGPSDRLQTREFKSAVEDLIAYRQSKDLSSKEALSAYLLYEWPLHYAEGLSLLKELPTMPSRVLELGAKAAAFSFAALQYGASEVCAVDTNEQALRSGAFLCGHFGYPMSVRTSEYKRLSSLTHKDKWELVILPYSLFSLFSSTEERLSYLQAVTNLITDDGHVLIVESSEAKTNQSLLMLRDAVHAANIPIAAPCLGIRNCPALKSGSFCYAQRPLEDKPFLIKELQRAAQINLNSLKMSYLLLKSPNAPRTTTPDNVYRVISPPVATFKGERYFLCGKTERKTIGSNLKEPPKASKAFAYLKRGDVIAVENTSEIEDDMLVTENSSVTLYAPCDKPLPRG